MTTTEFNKFLKFYFLIDFGNHVWNQEFVDELKLDVDEFIYLEGNEKLYEKVFSELHSNLFSADIKLQEIIFKKYFTDITNILVLIKAHRKFTKKNHKRKFIFREEFIFELYNNFLLKLFNLVLEREFDVHLIIESLDIEKAEIILEHKQLLLLFFKFKNPKISKKEFDSCYPFINSKGLEFFNKLHLIFKNNNSTHSDYSFIYQKMKDDNLFQANINQEMFIEFINSPEYKIEINDKFKTLIYCETFLKKTIYNLIKSTLFNC